MPKLAGTKRMMYTSQKVKEMRNERLNVKAKKDGVSDSQVQHYLGKLQAAGHMKVSGFKSMKIDSQDLRSASEVDKQYKLKGWFNEDGTIRIELVN